MNVEPRTLPARWSQAVAAESGDSIMGTLEFSEKEPTGLIHLTGDFGADEVDLTAFMTGTHAIDRYPILHGHTSEGMYTAIDARVTLRRESYGGGKLPEIILRPAYLIHGDVTLHEHELAVTRVNVRFWDQDAWAQWYNLRLLNATAEDKTVYIEQRQPERQSAQFDGVTVALRDASTTHYFPIGHGNISISQTSLFELTFDEEVPLNQLFTRWIAPLAFWISSGTRRMTGIEEMKIHNRNWKRDSDGSSISTWLSVTPRNPSPRPDKSTEIEFLHKLRHFNFSEQLQTVFRTFERHETVVRQYLDYLRTRPDTAMVQLTVLAQLVETFDRSLDPDPVLDARVAQDAEAAARAVGNIPGLNKYKSQVKRAVQDTVRPTLASRLKRLDGATDGVVSELLSGEPQWKDAIASVRNSIVHGLPSSAFFVKNIIPIQVSVDVLEILFELRLLVALGFSSDQAKEIVTEDDSNWGNRAYHIRNYLDSLGQFRDLSTSRVLTQSKLEG